MSIEHKILYLHISLSTVPPKKIKSCGMAKSVNESSQLSIESDVPKPSEEFSKAINNRLQSPIESHFAVTPITESKTGSPANGFTSSDCGELLCQELDSLVLNEELKSRPSKENIAGNDDLIHSMSPSIEELVLKKDDNNSKESISSKLSGDDLIPIDSSSTSFENLKSPDEKKSGLNELLSPADESISMFTQLSDKLTEMANEGDSGVDMAHNVSDDETCRPEVNT